MFRGLERMNENEFIRIHKEWRIRNKMNSSQTKSHREMHRGLCVEVNDTSIWMPKLNDFGNESHFSDDEKNVFVVAAELWTLWLLISTSTLEAHSRVYLLIDDIQRRSGKDEFPFQASALSWESTCYSRVRVQFSDLSFRRADCPFGVDFLY